MTRLKHAGSFSTFYFMIYKYIIFDRSIKRIEEIAELVSELRGNYELKGAATDIETAQKMIMESEADLILTGIWLKGGEVFNLFGGEIPYSCRVIYFNVSHRYTIQAFRSGAFDYVVKPFEKSNLQAALCRFESAVGNQYDDTEDPKPPRAGINKVGKIVRIGVATAKGLVMKNIQELVYVQAVSNYSEYCFNRSEKYTVSRTLLNIEVLLDSYGFLRVHKSFLVNLSYLQAFDNEKMILHLKNGEAIPVAVRRKSYLLNCLNRVHH